MIHRPSLVAVSTFTLLALGAAGCSADANSGASASRSYAPADTTAAQPATVESKVLATLDVGEGQTVTFRRIEPGMLTVEEQGPIGKTPIASAINGPILDVYRVLSKGAEPPAALVDAEAERARLMTAPIADLAAPPPSSAARASTGFGARLHPMTGTGLDTWFQNSFCNNSFSTGCVISNNQYVVTGWNWTNSVGNNSHVQNMQAWGLNNGSVASTLGLMIWNGYAWVTKTTTPLGVYRYNWLKSFTAGVSYWQGFQTSTGGDTALTTWAFAPKFDIAYDQNGWITFTGEQFMNDSAVSVTVSSGSLSETLGTFAVTSPSPTQQGYFGGDVLLRCSPYSTPGTYTATITAVGQQSGEVATGGVQISNCFL